MKIRQLISGEAVLDLLAMLAVAAIALLIVHVIGPLLHPSHNILSP